MITFAVRPVVGEIQDVAGQRAAPAVDRLVVVADDGEVAAGAGQQRDEPVLDGVGVLELVDQDVAAALAPALEDLRELPEELERENQQIVEVDGIVGLQRARVARGGLRGEDRVGVGAVAGIRLAPLVLGARDRGEHAFGIDVAAADQAHLAERFLQSRKLVGGVVDREVALVAEVLDLAPQHAHAEGVERRDRRGLGPLADKFFHPLLQLLGRFVRESDREDRPGRDAALHEVGDAVRERARLAGAGTGEDQQRAVAVKDGFALARVESVQILAHESRDYRDGGGRGKETALTSASGSG